MKDDAMTALLRAQAAQVKSGRSVPVQLPLLEPDAHRRPECERAELLDRPRRKRRK